eukprot:765655-Amphidinium_carterae.2
MLRAGAWTVTNTTGEVDRHSFPAMLLLCKATTALPAPPLRSRCQTPCLLPRMTSSGRSFELQLDSSVVCVP